jgi:hypothetical protein
MGYSLVGESLYDLFIGIRDYWEGLGNEVRDFRVGGVVVDGSIFVYDVVGDCGICRLYLVVSQLLVGGWKVESRLIGDGDVD